MTYVVDIVNEVKLVNVDKLVDMFNEYNKTYQWTIKIKPINLKPSAYINFT